MFYLKLKNSSSKHSFYCNLEESGVYPNKTFMDVHKPKYAEEFTTKEQASLFKEKHDPDDDFQIVDSLN